MTRHQACNELERLGFKISKSESNPLSVLAVHPDSQNQPICPDSVARLFKQEELKVVTSVDDFYHQLHAKMHVENNEQLNLVTSVNTVSYETDGLLAEPKEAVNHPPHYNKHPSGVECIDIIEHMRFNLGNAVKYIWRADLKGKSEEDLKKAIWYLQREINTRNGKTKRKTD